MYRLTNKLNRRIGLPVQIRESGILLDIGEIRTVSNDHYKELIRSQKTMGLISSGGLIAEKVELVSNG